MLSINFDIITTFTKHMNIKNNSIKHFTFIHGIVYIIDKNVHFFYQLIL